MSVTTLDPPVSVHPVPQTMTVEEYLAFERCAEIRHEYVEGRLIPMPGTSLTHNDIAMNIAVLLRTAFRGRNCFVQMESIRLRVSPTRYRYPDVMALCGERETDDGTPPSLLNPSLIVEVLSCSTAEEDRENKWPEYKRIPTLTDYLLIEQDRVSVTHHKKQNARQWLETEYTELDQTITLSSLTVSLALTEIYAEIPLPETAS